jgi:hypothetical protein
VNGACLKLFRARTENPEEKSFNAEGTEETPRTRRRLDENLGYALAEVGDFFVEVGEGGFQGFAMLGMGGGGEVVYDAGAR